jgi:hypothetical protein
MWTVTSFIALEAPRDWILIDSRTMVSCWLNHGCLFGTKQVIHRKTWCSVCGAPWLIWQKRESTARVWNSNSCEAFSRRNSWTEKASPASWALQAKVGWRILGAYLPHMRYRPSCGSSIIPGGKLRRPCCRPSISPSMPWICTKVHKKASSSAAIICHCKNQILSYRLKMESLTTTVGRK